MRTYRSVLVAIAMVLAASALAACSGGDDEGADAQPPESTSSTTTTLEQNEQATAALAVWEEYVTVSPQWLDPPDPAHPRIADFIAEDSLETFREGIARDLAQDIATRPGPNGPPTHHPEVRSAERDRVVVRDCFVDDTVGVSMRTGEAVDDAVVTRTIDATLVADGESWKILEIDEVTKEPGAATCD
jgi:hypothetical protein